MSKVNLKSSMGIIHELEQAIQDVKADPDSLKSSQTVISGCKHAIQMFAVSMEHARMTGRVGTKLKPVELESPVLIEN